MAFCHLHLHNEYSVLDGVGTSKQYANLAKELGQTHICLSNHGNIDGAIEHQKQCLEAGIQPIIGAEMYMVPDISIKTKGETRYHITLLVENQTGWRNLLQLLTIANIEGYYHRPRIDHKTLMKHIDGLVVMSACSSSFLLLDVENWMLNDYIQALGKDRVFLEVMPHLIPEQIKINKLALKLSKELGIQIVATNDCHYPTNEATKHQEVLLAIQSKKKWDDPTRWKFNCDGLYLRSEKEMYQAFKKQLVLSEPEISQAIRRTMKVAKICENFRIEQQPVYLPSLNRFFSEQDEIDFLRLQIHRGIRRRLKGKSREQMEAYRERIEIEMELIISKKFVRYFLIVWDLIIWCQQNNIMTGPGRGSAGGCLVAYLLFITDCDPLVYGTEFFRFISAERADLPDIDMDFEDVRRDEVRKYLSDKYGEFNVVGLSNFLTMKGKGVLRDVSRVFDVPLPEVDLAAKAMVEADEGQEIAKSFAEVQECRRFGQKYPEAVEIAQAIEGQIRGHGQHAAGVCISEKDLREGHNCNLVTRAGTIVANWDMRNAEYCGLMKLDILGLSALTILNECRRMVKENHGVDINYKTLTFDDPKVFAEISEGNTVGAFQIGSNGLTKYCQELGVENFAMLYAVTALWRPGPMQSGMTESYSKRKRGKEKVEKIHPIFDKLTKETFGVIVYQEQVMKVVNQLAGISMATCNKIRKVIGKSMGNAAFDKYKEEFLQGCKNQGSVPEKKAIQIWDMMSKFGGYGFNLSHSVEYSMITYWDMYCVDGTTRIWSGDTGEFTTVSKAFKTGLSSTLCYDENTKETKLGKVKSVLKKTIRKAPEMIYTVRTKSGKHLRATKDHRILTNNGFKRLFELKVKDLVAVERRINFWEQFDDEKLNKIKSSISKKTKEIWSACSEEEWNQKRSGFVNYQKSGRMNEIAKKNWNAHDVETKERLIANLIESGKKSTRGYHTRFIGFAEDGHKVFSTGELLVDDWLYLHNIPHEKEVRIGNKISRERSDFKALGLFIEFDGLNRPDSYFEKKFGDEPYIVIKGIKEIDKCLSELLEPERALSGKEIIFEPIISITEWKIRDTVYDIEMEDEPHNFLANGMVVHNSKVHYPNEFLASCLTLGDKTKNIEYIREARRLGLKINFPKIGVSHAIKWNCDKKGNLFSPFVSINGVGELVAEKIASATISNKVRKGFFSSAPSEKIPGVNKNVTAILNDIKAFDPEYVTTKEDLKKYKHLFIF